MDTIKVHIPMLNECQESSKVMISNDHQWHIWGGMRKEIYIGHQSPLNRTYLCPYLHQMMDDKN